MWITFWIVAIQLVAGFFVGLTSFGSNLFGIPMMALIINIKDAIIVSLLATVPVWLLVAIIYRRHLLWKEIAMIAACGFAGGPFGTWLLANAHPFWLFLGAGICLSLIIIWQILANYLSKTSSPMGIWLALPLGLASGIMTGCIGMGGPPLMVYAYLRHWSKGATIACGSLCSIAQMLPVIPAQWQAGFYTSQIMVLSFWGCVAGAAGMLLSFPVINRINQLFFRRLLLSILGVSAITLLVKAWQTL